MIKNYYGVTILWGRSGRVCAERIASVIKELHENDYIPVRSYIFQKEIMNSSSIMDTVIDKIKQSKACIIILTFDDCEGTRVRQNILIETGIAWSILGKDNLIFLSNKEQLPEDFPSNIKSEIQINYYDVSNAEITVKKVCDELISSFDVKSNKDLLFASDYIYDGKVLDDIEPFVKEGKTEIQLYKIINKWIKNIEEFDFLQEKLLYVLERVAFFPVMGSEENILKFLSEIDKMLVPTKLDLKHSKDGISIELTNVLDLTKEIIKYTRLKTEKETKECINNPMNNTRMTERVEKNFRNIYERLKRIIDDFENGKTNYIWLIRIIAYDYAALSKLRMYEIDVDPSSEDNKKDLEDAIELFNKAIDLADKYDLHSEKLWLGYLKYNLARALYRKYLIYKDKDILNIVKDNILDAIEYRESWSKSDYYKGIFATALSYEYYIASFYDYTLRNSCDGYSSDSKLQIIKDVKKLREEINDYCMESELGSLYKMRDKIDEFIKENEIENS